MKTYTIFKSKQATSDGLYIFNFKTIPQNSYIQVHNLFGKSDKKMLRKASEMLKVSGLLPAMVEIKEI